MSTILALDPGTNETGFVAFDAKSHQVVECGVKANDDMLVHLQSYRALGLEAALAIEMIASYGMAVGREVFETCVWIGRFQQAWHAPKSVRLVYRREVKLHVCKSAKASDSEVRRGLLDLFPATGGGATPQVGTKGNPGPLYGVSSHAWPALGVAVTVLGIERGERPRYPHVDLLGEAA